MNIYENGEFKVSTENCDSVTWGQRHVDGAPVAFFYDGWVETKVVLRG